MSEKTLLDVQNLSTYFFTRRGVGKAVDGVSFSLKQGETLGLVGESGCGKTVACLSILRMVPQPAGRIVGGKIIFKGVNILKNTENEMRRIRGKQIAMILQDPMSSLDPVFSINDQLAEAIRMHQHLRRTSLWERAVKMLRLVQIPSPETRLREFPHQLSGGMRQRVVGAIALACEPDLLIADEPTTSLDATVQAQYLSLLKEIQRQSQVAMLFITHDFGVVALLCDRVAVMYAGKIVETAPVGQIFDEPIHPYTSALINSVPKIERRVSRLKTIEGQPPDVTNLPPGCSFYRRCPKRIEKCQLTPPVPVQVENEHWVSCWLQSN